MLNSFQQPILGRHGLGLMDMFAMLMHEFFLAQCPMIMEMLRTNDAICYAYLNDECIKTHLLQRQHRGAPGTALKLSLPRPFPPCWG